MSSYAKTTAVVVAQVFSLDAIAFGAAGISDCNKS
jgi:hypothetical protein